MERRDPSASKTRVAVTDGERALQIRVSRKLNVTLILDLIHVLEKLGKAAYVFHAEGSLEADLWVMDRTPRILGQVVKGIRQSITKRGLSGARRKTLEGVADYLYRNRTRMRYDEYLANGWPIASGPVEGACKHLIKDRMERFRHALDRTDGGSHSTTQSHLSFRRLRLLLAIPYPTGSATPISRRLDRRSKVATPFSNSFQNLIG